MRGILSWLLLLVPMLVGSAPAALAGDEALCAAAIRTVEARARLPRGLLGAVALSESGRRAPGQSGGITAWPWTVNNAGDGRYFASKAEAVAWIEALRAAGRRNIDVGCMQVNLMYHPDAFADLEEALDPSANVAYAARFLTTLRDETASWERAVARYHTAEPERGEAYRSRVYAHWRGDAPHLGSSRRLGGRGSLGLVRPAVLRPVPFLARESRGSGRGLARPQRLLPLRSGQEPIGVARRRGGGRLPAVLGPGGPGPVAAALPNPARTRGVLLAPAPGRIAVLTGSGGRPAVRMLTVGRLPPGSAPAARAGRARPPPLPPGG